MRIPNQFRDSAPALLAVLLVFGAAVDAALASTPASFGEPTLDATRNGTVDQRSVPMIQRSVPLSRPWQTAEPVVVEPVEEDRGSRPGTRLGSDNTIRPRHPAPAVVRFRPRAGSAGVSPWANLSVRFTIEMAHGTTEAAFSVTVAGRELPGTTWWAEGNTVLVFDPKAALSRGAHVTLSVGTGAHSSEGTPLAESVAVSFTVAAAPDPSIPGATSSGWRWPLTGPITQRFGESLTKYGLHEGIDIDGTTGDPVRAARSGIVAVAGHYDGCGGLEVHIDHGDGLVSWYRHLSRIDAAVGQQITAGTVIGAVGNTGCSLGSHLHFAIRRGPTFIDPLGYLPPH